MDSLIEAVVVLVTAPPGEPAEKIARHVLDRKLAACVNIVPSIRSLYWWEGKVCDDAECLLVIKTERKRLAELEAAVRSVHPYEVPEVIALPVVDGSDAYLQWIAAVVRT